MFCEIFPKPFDLYIAPSVENLHGLHKLPTDILSAIFGHLTQSDLLHCQQTLPAAFHVAIADAISRRTIRLNYAQHLDDKSLREQLLRSLPPPTVTRLCVVLANTNYQHTAEQREEVYAFLHEHYLTSARLTHLRLIGFEEFSPGVARPLGQNLRVLHVLQSDISDATLIEYLKAIHPEQFRDLRIAQCRSIRGQFLQHLATVQHQLHTLHLTVRESSFPEKLYEYLSQCPALLQLGYEENQPRVDVGHPTVAAMVQLRRLRVRDSGPHPPSLVGLTKLANLQHISVRMTGDGLNRWLAALPADNRLQSVDMRLANCDFRPEDARLWRRLKRVHTLGLVLETTKSKVSRGRNLDYRDAYRVRRVSTVLGLSVLMQLLAELPALRRLELNSDHHGVCLPQNRVSRALIAAALPRLRHLRCQGMAVGESADWVDKMPELRTLHLDVGSRKEWQDGTEDALKLLRRLCEHKRIQWLTVECVIGIVDVLGKSARRTRLKIDELSAEDKRRLKSMITDYRMLDQWVTAIMAQEDDDEAFSDGEEDWMQ